MLVVRPTTDSDLPGLSALYVEGFGRALSPAEWEWKYRQLPGEGRSMVAVADGEVLAHAGAYALGARWRGGPRNEPRGGLAWQLADFVGRPRGLRPPLVVAGRALLADLPRSGDLPAIFGFPSARHLELGERVFGYRWLSPIVPWEGAIPAARDDRVDASDTAGDWAEAAWEACSVAGVRRTAAFLNWRYCARPERYYRVYRLRAGGCEGLAVAAFVGTAAWLAELWLPPGADWSGPLLGVAADLRSSGLSTWRAWPQPMGVEQLQRLGMAPVDEAVPCGCRGGRGSDGAEVVALARSLYYSMGDHDMV